MSPAAWLAARSAVMMVRRVGIAGALDRTENDGDFGRTEFKRGGGQ
jgi:hypothetical protein